MYMYQNDTFIAGNISNFEHTSQDSGWEKDIYLEKSCFLS